MLKKIKNSLTARIFIVTCLLLIFTSSITYIFISVMTPVTYSSKLDRTLEQKVHHLIEKLEQTTLEDSSTIFDRFLMDSGATIFLRYPDGSITLPPSNLVIDSSSDPNIAIGKENEETIYIGDGKIIPNTPHDITAAKEYSFSFSQSDTQYTLLVSGKMGTINQVTSVLLQILPWLIRTIVLISTIAAFFYSRYITKPIVSISNISKKMSLMELECRCEEN
ncbi:hypothetical protein KQI38_00275 [Tissierella carlieri]|uniref:hypothetical protein n=1 Tax=Tissierella carlieri TaxID=689904 RepID=UPI001C0F5412|nr:hypothetical protein [Tissierella carlieri]MBU5310451.1 hypothetical protein [Tissierella carlieri]